MTEPLIPVAPALDAPLEILSACHGRIHARLETLDRLLRWLPEHGADADARQAAAGVIRYFDTAGVNHQRDEEADLFPRLIARVPLESRKRVHALIDWSKDDHAAISAAWDALRGQLLQIAQGASTDLGADDVANFSARYLSHMDREDNELFPYAAQLLTNEDLHAMSTAMKARRTAPDRARGGRPTGSGLG